ITNNAGQIVSFTVTNSGTPPLTYFWYKETALTTNLLTITANPTLTLSGITGSDTANYQVVASNITTATATSSVVSLTVTNDPNILFQPSSAQGLINGTARFTVVAAASSPVTYQWYFSDTNGTIIAPVPNGTQGDGSVNSGAASSTLTIANLQPGDLTNFAVV